MVRGPIIRQFAKMRSFLKLASLGLLDFVFGANRGDCFCGVHTGAFGVDFPQWWVSLDAFVEARLGDGGIVHFAVSMTAIADKVNDDVAAKRGAIVCRNLADAHNGVGIFRIYVKNRNVLTLGKVCCEARGVFLHGAGCETNQIVDDDLNRTADSVGGEAGEVQRFRKNSLSGESGIAMHDNRPHFVGVKAGGTAGVSGEFGADTADGDGINCFKVAGIGDQMDANLFPVRGDVVAGCADVILHVAGAKNATRVHVFKSCDDFVRRFARGVDHDIEAAAVAHGHNGFSGAVFSGCVENGVEERNERCDAFERKTFGAEIARLENLFKQVGANQARENYVAIGFRTGGLHALSNPAAAFGLEQVQEVRADGAGVDSASGVGVRTRKIKVRRFQGFEEAKRIEAGFEVAPAAKSLEAAVAVGGLGGGGSRAFW